MDALAQTKRTLYESGSVDLWRRAWITYQEYARPGESPLSFQERVRSKYAPYVCKTVEFVERPEGTPHHANVRIFDPPPLTETGTDGIL